MDLYQHIDTITHFKQFYTLLLPMTDNLKGELFEQFYLTYFHSDYGQYYRYSDVSPNDRYRRVNVWK